MWRSCASVCLRYVEALMFVRWPTLRRHFVPSVWTREQRGDAGVGLPVVSLRCSRNFSLFRQIFPLSRSLAHIKVLQRSDKPEVKISRVITNGLWKSGINRLSTFSRKRRLCFLVGGKRPLGHQGALPRRACFPPAAQVHVLRYGPNGAAPHPKGGGGAGTIGELQVGARC